MFLIKTVSGWAHTVPKSKVAYGWKPYSPTVHHLMCVNSAHIAVVHEERILIGNKKDYFWKALLLIQADIVIHYNEKFSTADDAKLQIEKLLIDDGWKFLTPEQKHLL